MKRKIILIVLLLFSDRIFSFGGPITNDVRLTRLATFSLRSHEGPLTNQFDADQHIAFAISTDMTNEFFCHLPPADHLFDFHLFDDQGHEVPKTAIGLAMSNPLDPMPSKAYLHFKSHNFFGSDIEEWGVPMRFFEIQNPGVYELEIRVRILLPMTNGVTDYNSITNGTNFMRAHLFGVVTSEAVRVEIVKKKTD